MGLARKRWTCRRFAVPVIPLKLAYYLNEPTPYAPHFLLVQRSAGEERPAISNH